MERHYSMKKSLAFFVFLLGSLSILSAQSLPSQFSAPSAKPTVTAQAANKSQSSTFTATKKSSRMHANISGSNPPSNPVPFMSSTQIAANGLTQWSAVVADFNGDGLVDIAAPVQGAVGSYAISVALSNGNGTFQTGALIPNTRGTSGDQILYGDFANKGQQDLIVVHNITPSTFELWVPTGNGTFSVPTSAPTQISTNYLEGGAVWDVNGDGNLDLVFVDSHSPANVWVLLGNGDGTFRTPTSVPLSGSVSNVIFADFNGDGVLDLAGITGTQDTVYLGQANGTFVAGAALTNPDGKYDVCNNAAGALSSGGQYDIVTANCSSGGAAGNLTVYVNNGNGTFQTGVYYAAGTESLDNTVANISPLAVSIADVNGDGKPDVVVSNHDSGDITVLLGNGNGTLNVPTVGYNTGGNPKTSAIVQDFNGDGIPDLVVPDDNLSFIYMQGYGDGSFRSALDFYSPVPGGFSAGATSIASGDFNNDGIPDLVIGNNGYNPSGSGLGVTVFLSNPDGSMQRGTNWGTGGAYQGVAVGDFNGDGNLDIAAVNQSNNGVQIFFGEGNGNFSSGGYYPTTGTNAVKIIAADFNGDGKPDLAVLNAGSTNVSVFLNNGDGTFGTAATYTNSAAGIAIATADVNNDGILDLIVSQGNQGVDVFLGSSTSKGTFKPAITSTLGFNNLGNLALGDLNGDGNLDLAVTVDDKVTPNEGIAVAQGNGQGSFTSPILIATTLQNTLLSPPNPGDVKMFDLKGTGTLDLVYSNSYYGTVGVLYNTGTNVFATMFYDPVENAVGSGGAGDPSNVIALALADVNNDGAVDVEAVNYNYSGVGILLNASGNSNKLNSATNPAAATQSVTLTADLAATVRGVTAVPTGSVTFLDGSTTLGSATVNSGVATFNATTLAIGTHNITAQYSGDSNFHTSTSTVLNEVVNLATDTTNLTAPGSTVGVGQSVTFGAAISANATGVSAVPTGNVGFYGGATLLGSVALTSGKASFTTSTLASGANSITAKYSGDANFAASTSSAFAETVVAPDFNLTANKSTATVNPGSSATYTLSVTPTYGYNAAVSFSCPASLPAKVTCSFSPASVSATGGTYPSTTLTLSTTAAVAELVPPVRPNANPMQPTLLASLSGFGLVGMVFIGAANKRNRRHMMVLAVILVVMMICLVGCGGGGSSSNNNNNTGTPGTPAGSYSLTVTATGTGATSQTVGVTLIVQ
jgi:Bacterial Ig-like domain (group 3)/FG-GAP-like repeat